MGFLLCFLRWKNDVTYFCAPIIALVPCKSNRGGCFPSTNGSQIELNLPTHTARVLSRFSFDRCSFIDHNKNLMWRASEENWKLLFIVGLRIRWRARDECFIRYLLQVKLCPRWYSSAVISDPALKNVLNFTWISWHVLMPRMTLKEDTKVQLSITWELAVQLTSIPVVTPTLQS